MHLLNTVSPTRFSFYYKAFSLFLNNIQDFSTWIIFCIFFSSLLFLLLADPVFRINCIRLSVSLKQWFSNWYKHHPGAYERNLVSMRSGFSLCQQFAPFHKERKCYITAEREHQWNTGVSSEVFGFVTWSARLVFFWAKRIWLSVHSKCLSNRS